jgi:hypothetical protein
MSTTHLTFSWHNFDGNYPLTIKNDGLIVQPYRNYVSIKFGDSFTAEAGKAVKVFADSILSGVQQFNPASISEWWKEVP